MSSRVPHNTPAPDPAETPADGDEDGSRNGAGAQTALLAMLKKRTMRVNRDADGERAPEDAGESG